MTTTGESSSPPGAGEPAPDPATGEVALAGEGPASATPRTTPAGAAAALADMPDTTARLVVIGGGLSTVAVGVVVSYLLWRWLQPPPPRPVEGLGVFAALYVLAQAIERLLEPVSQLLLPSARLAKRREQAVAALRADPADAASREAVVRAEAALDQRRADRAVVFWALATFLALVATAVLGLRLLSLVGVTTAPAGLEIVVTGLAIGGGSKPLHDLVSRLEKGKNKAQDAAGASSV